MFRRGLSVLTLIVSCAVLAACGDGEESAGPPLSADAQAGKDFFAKSCRNCHSTDGRSGAGPSVKGLAGSTVTLADGNQVVADDTYLRTALQDPDAQIAEGYRAGVMSALYPKGELDDETTRQLVEYLKTVK